MLVAGHTEETVREALARANSYHDGNLDIHQLERSGTTGRSKYLKVRITVKETRGRDGEVLPGVLTARNFGSGRPERAFRKASWDAHGYFMAELFNVNPDTLIRIGSVANGGVHLRSGDDLIAHWSEAANVIERPWARR